MRSRFLFLPRRYLHRPCGPAMLRAGRVGPWGVLSPGPYNPNHRSPPRGISRSLTATVLLSTRRIRGGLSRTRRRGTGRFGSYRIDFIASYNDRLPYEQGVLHFTTEYCYQDGINWTPWNPTTGPGIGQTLWADDVNLPFTQYGGIFGHWYHPAPTPCWTSFAFGGDGDGDHMRTTLGTGSFMVYYNGPEPACKLRLKCDGVVWIVVTLTPNAAGTDFNIFGCVSLGPFLVGPAVLPGSERVAGLGAMEGPFL